MRPNYLTKGTKNGTHVTVSGRANAVEHQTRRATAGGRPWRLVGARGGGGKPSASAKERAVSASSLEWGGVLVLFAGPDSRAPW